MLSFDSSLTALRAAQIGLRVAANNQANAATPGYHRQRLQLGERATTPIDGIATGTGVNSLRVDRSVSAIAQYSLNQSISQQGAQEASLETLQSLEGVFDTNSGGLTDRLSQFFHQLDQWTVNPGDLTQRRAVLQSAQQLTKAFHQAADRLDTLQSSVDHEIQGTLDEVNGLIKQIAELNVAISTSRGGEQQPLDLLDRRDALLEQLAERTDASVPLRADADGVVTLASGAVSFSTQPIALVMSTNAMGERQITWQDGTTPLDFASGRLAGLLQGGTDRIDAARSQLDTITLSLAQAVDRMHSAGVGLSGPFTQLTGVRAVTAVDAPLDQVAGKWPLSSGQVTVAVTEAATGERRLFAVDVDPAQDTLEDLATKLSGISHVSATVNPRTQLLSVATAPGFSVDFAGGLPTSMTTSPGWTGTASGLLSGRPTGTINGKWTLTVIQGGQVGVDADVRAEVRDAAGTVLGTVQLGSSYLAGKPIAVAQGVEVQFRAGTLVAGDTSTWNVVPNPDEVGLWPALGMRSFFQGDSAGNLAVRDDLWNDPRELAAGTTALPGDNSIARRLAALRDAGLPELQGQSATVALDGLTVEVGAETAATRWSVDQATAFSTSLREQRDSVSGVDLNEELANMLTYQRMFQAASKFLKAADENLQELMTLVR
jgi:flagellar hook-associated protein 1 FlgK